MLHRFYVEILKILKNYYFNYTVHTLMKCNITINSGKYCLSHIYIKVLYVCNINIRIHKLLRTLRVFLKQLDTKIIK